MNVATSTITHAHDVSISPLTESGGLHAGPALCTASPRNQSQLPLREKLRPSNSENTLLGVQGFVQGGGGIKFLPLGVSKFTHPSLPLHMPSGPKNGERGRGGV